MIRVLKLGVVFVFLAGGLFAFSLQFGVSEAADRTEISEIEASRNLYLNNCARCHGADGRADTELGKLYGSTDLTARKVQKMSRKKMARIIKNGSGSMPSFGRKLDNNQINSIVNFVYSLD